MTEVRLRSQALEWREIEGEIVALDVEKARYLAVNRTGVALWRALVEGSTTEQLVARVRETFEVDPDRATADVESFLRSLREQGLLEELDGS